MSRAGKALTISLGFVLVALIIVLAAAWYFAGLIEEQALVVRHEPHTFDLRVASIEGGRITLEAESKTASYGRWDRPGIWGLESADTYNRVGRIVDTGDGSVVRELIALGPLPPVGAAVRIDRVPIPSTRFSRTGSPSRRSASRRPYGRFPLG